MMVERLVTVIRSDDLVVIDLSHWHGSSSFSCPALAPACSRTSAVVSLHHQIHKRDVSSFVGLPP